MTRQVLAVTSAILAFAVLSSTTQAVTIKHGTYKIRREVVKSSKDVLWHGIPSICNGSTSLKDKCPELVSAYPLKGTSGQFEVIVDESKGTGKGNDTAYLLPKELPNDKIDLKIAVKVPLKMDEDGISTNKDNPIPVYLSFGKGKDRITQLVPVCVAFDPRAELNLLIVPLVNLVGTLQTDNGDLPIYIINSNPDGIYGKTPVFYPELGACDGSEEIIIGNIRARELHDYDLSFLGSPILYAGKLYKFTISSSGGNLTVEPYSGECGSLKVFIRDGNVLPASYRSITATSKSALFSLNPSEVYDLPCGEYMLRSRITYGKGNEAIKIEIVPKDWTKINKDKETFAALGGPISLELKPELSTLKLKPGEEVSLEIHLKAGEDKLEYINRPITVKIFDFSGKELINQKLSIYSPWTPYKLKAPMVTGKYTLVTIIDPSPYQGVVETRQSFVVQQ